jgi:hypothetical protein
MPAPGRFVLGPPGLLYQEGEGGLLPLFDYYRKATTDFELIVAPRSRFVQGRAHFITTNCNL